MLLRVVAALALLTATARADGEGAVVEPSGPAGEPPVGVQAPEKPRISTQRRIAAVVAAVGPGLVVRGAGSWIVGEKRAARRLFYAGLVGAGVAAVGGAPVGLSGGNAYTIPVGIPLLVLGSGLFLATWPSDVLVAAGVDKKLVQAPRANAPWSIELGTVWLHDPYRDRGLGRLAGTLALGRVEVGATTLLDAENRSRDGDLESRVRIAGAPATGAVIADGSRIEVRNALRVHDDDDDRLTYSVGELELAGRLDLARLDDVFGGTFLELSAGVGISRVDYADNADYGTNLLGTFAWGFYLAGRGEIAAFYDHRRDHLAGGIAAGRAAGFVGSIGGSADVRVARNWAVRAELEYGNAWVTTFALRYEGIR